jgi:leucyl aminopeptidase
MTILTVSTSTAASLPADAIVIGVAQGPGGLVPAPGGEAVLGAVGATLQALGATGAEGEAVRVPSPAGFAAPVVLAVGLGDGSEALRRAAGVAARTLAGAGRVALALPAATAEAAEAVGLGGLLGAYAFTAYRTTGDAKAPVGELTILTSPGHRTEVEAGARRATVLGQELNRCRDLVNLPANDLDPESFAAAVRAAGEEHGLDVEVLDEQALAEHSFGGILGVGQGSGRPPRLVRIAYTHPEATTSLAFVGKGITYDSGGISLKPVGANEIMKRDMSGAAAVFAAVVAAARLGLRVSVTGWLALAENMPSGTALRPGDVLRMYGGRTVEVRNTDAEGHLVLADTLVRAAEDGPDAIVDVATLTAAMKLALGHRTFGVLSGDDAFRRRVLDAAERAGEPAWPMPLPAELRESLDSPVADLANTGEPMGGGSVAALFLREFVPDGTPWAHLDIAGPAFNESAPFGYTPQGGTGSAVRTLVRLAEDAAAGLGMTSPAA